MATADCIVVVGVEAEGELVYPLTASYREHGARIEHIEVSHIEGVSVRLPLELCEVSALPFEYCDVLIISIGDCHRTRLTGPYGFSLDPNSIDLWQR